MSLADAGSLDHLETCHLKVHVDIHLTCPLVLYVNKADLSERVPRPRVMGWAADHSCRVVFASAMSGSNIRET